LVNLIIDNYNAGIGLRKTTMESFSRCIRFANEYANWYWDYPMEGPDRREQRRGQIVCGEGD